MPPPRMSAQLAVVAMIRNEADILPAFLSHLRLLFDRALVIDHMSTDGSREILNAARDAGYPLDIYTYGARGYFQAALSSAFARKALAEGADWVFFLDADEFVDVPDRAALLGLLSGCGVAAEFRWRNLAPTHFGSFEHIDLAQGFLAAGTTSTYGKVAISRAILEEAPSFFLELGNHAVRSAPRMPRLPAREIGEFLHIPIRSFDRLHMKVEAGAAAYRAKSRSRSVDGFHWFELLERVRRGTLDEDFLRTVALSYGEKLDTLTTHPTNALVRRIAPPGIAPDGPSPLARSGVETAARDRAVAWTIFEAEGDENVLVRIEEDKRVTLRTRISRPDGSDGPDVFDTLPDERAPIADDLSPARIASVADLVCRPIETLVPSAWSRLVPAMFALVALLRPRRFVELGSHYGLSFFAANQAMKTLDLPAETIAIDSWQGDPQAGHYGEDVFADFTHILRTRYPDRAHYIRASFDQALACFETGSIDLLHIDGLHTYDAVRNDFETWLPKMSNRGVVILHDTTVYEADFGVWQYWRELAARFPTLNLLHGHGLGIVYVGQPCRFAGTLREVAADPYRYDALNAFFRGLGDLALMAAEGRQGGSAVNAPRPGSEHELAGADAALAAERAARASAEAQVAAMRNSTSWKITWPMRKLRRIIRSG